MARTTSDIVIDASAAEIMVVIADFASYPQWATGIKQADVLETGSAERADEVFFSLDEAPIKDEYVLAYEWDGDRQVSWSMAKSGQMLRSMDGAYILDVMSDHSTRVTYQLAVDLSIPLLGMLKRKAEKVIIDTALKGLKTRVEGSRR